MTVTSTVAVALEDRSVTVSLHVLEEGVPSETVAVQVGFDAVLLEMLGVAPVAVDRCAHE